jgi:hypothetical protein
MGSLSGLKARAPLAQGIALGLNPRVLGAQVGVAGFRPSPMGWAKKPGPSARKGGNIRQSCGDAVQAPAPVHAIYLFF